MAKAQIIPDLDAVEALGQFDGRPVTRTSIKVTNAGDGLSEALEVDPKEFHLDDEVFVVLRTRVSKVEHRALDDDADGPIERAHVLKAGAATIVDKDLVASQIAVQIDRIRKAREAAQGVMPIPPANGSDDDPWAGEQPSSGMYDDDDEVGGV